MANNRNNNYNNRRNRDDEFYFDIIEHLEVLSVKDNGWKKELNVVSWKGNPAKLDLREWDTSHEKMTKGVTLAEEEALLLMDALCRRFGFKVSDADAPGSEPQASAPAAAPAAVAAPAAAAPAPA